MALSEHFSIKMSNGEAPPKLYRGVNKGLYVWLSRTQAGPGRTVKQEQEEISRNHVQTFIYLYVYCPRLFTIKSSFFNLVFFPALNLLLLRHRRSFLRKPIRAIEFYFYCFKKSSHACAAPRRVAGDKEVPKSKP